MGRGSSGGAGMGRAGGASRQRPTSSVGTNNKNIVVNFRPVRCLERVRELFSLVSLKKMF